MIDYRFAYLIGNLFICFPIWLILVLSRRDLFKEIIFISLIGAFVGPLSELWYLTDYWKPLLFNNWMIGIEDFLFGFFISGIATSLYEEVFGKRFIKRNRKNPRWYLGVFPFLILGIILTSILVFGVGINSLYSSAAILIIFSFVIIYKRRDLILDSLLSGILLGMIFILIYLVLLTVFPELINRFWYLDNLSNIFVLRIPVEELIWAFAVGMFVGPIYEFLVGLRFKK